MLISKREGIELIFSPMNYIVFNLNVPLCLCSFVFVRFVRSVLCLCLSCVCVLKFYTT